MIYCVRYYEKYWMLLFSQSTNKKPIYREKYIPKILKKEKRGREEERKKEGGREEGERGAMKR
jgi:hypothetical protein